MSPASWKQQTISIPSFASRGGGTQRGRRPASRAPSACTPVDCPFARSWSLYPRSLFFDTSVSAQSGEPTPSHQEVAAASASTAGSSYIPVDSWIYSAALRLYYLGYLPTAYLGLRPWTRASLAHMLELSQESLQSPTAPGEAIEINARLRRELAPELDGDRSPGLRAASVYTRVREIHGNILNDSFHFGQSDCERLWAAR